MTTYFVYKDKTNGKLDAIGFDNFIDADSVSRFVDNRSDSGNWKSIEANSKDAAIQIAKSEGFGG